MVSSQKVALVAAELKASGSYKSVLLPMGVATLLQSLVQTHTCNITENGDDVGDNGIGYHLSSVHSVGMTNMKSLTVFAPIPCSSRHGQQSRQNWKKIPTVPLKSSMTLGKSFTRFGFTLI